MYHYKRTKGKIKEKTNLNTCKIGWDDRDIGRRDNSLRTLSNSFGFESILVVYIVKK